MPAVYRYDLKVNDAAVDGNGHVNNVQYVQWMQDVAVMHSETTGCTKATRDCGATWVVRTHRIEYFRPAFAGDNIAVLTWVVNFRKVRSLRKYRFVRVTDNVLLAEGETDWVFVDVHSGRPRVIPDTVSGAFETLPEDGEPPSLLP
ncbi:MAG: acyl-CoA thioesterase [Kiritimatiellae bacterium]|nr:acyl-CoA thioesterase [Kiritimatiellia bacterium]MDD5521007.1 acyl-CoA thioesterase [Kiritimatiellia bacterium]